MTKDRWALRADDGQSAGQAKYLQAGFRKGDSAPQNEKRPTLRQSVSIAAIKDALRVGIEAAQVSVGAWSCDRVRWIAQHGKRSVTTVP